MKIEQLKKLYGKGVMFAIAYGSGDKLLSDQHLGKKRIIKKKIKRLREKFKNLDWRPFDPCKSVVLKGTFKKGCNKRKIYTKLIPIKDETIVLHVGKQCLASGKFK